MRIEPDDLSRAAVEALIREHLTSMYKQSPAESVHALGLDKLRSPAISCWSAWDGETLLGFGALKSLGNCEGEIKSMRTPARMRRRGAGRAILQHILDEARSRGYVRLYLETGIHPAFGAAIGLYESVGFRRCGPFGDYVDDPNSVFMSLALNDLPGGTPGQVLRQALDERKPIESVRGERVEPHSQ